MFHYMLPSQLHAYHVPEYYFQYKESSGIIAFESKISQKAMLVYIVYSI